MKRVLILYFSGAGAAKRIVGLMDDVLSGKCKTELRSFEQAAINLSGYDAFIIGTPCYHAAPSRIVMDYFSAMQPLDRPVPAFIFNTRATWSCNTNRILAGKLKDCNILTIMDRDYRSPASDGSLIVPFVRRFREFDLRLHMKIRQDCTAFLSLLDQPIVGYIPHFRLSSIVNAPNKLAGQLIIFPIYLHRQNCSRCGRCSSQCPHHARGRDAEGYPTFIPKKCENCYRCIHHCPGKALSLSKRATPRKQLYIH